jgi:hypothetical protein
MSTDSQTGSQFYQSFKSNLEALRCFPEDLLLNRLLFSQIITLLEKYLLDVFIHEITTNTTKLQTLANHNKFREQKLGIAFALNNSVRDWIIDTMRKMVWHRLNDVQILYKAVLGITFELERPIIEAINKRHDLIHRNGFDLRGNNVPVTHADLCGLINAVDSFVINIDEKYNAVRCGNPS